MKSKFTDYSQNANYKKTEFFEPTVGMSTVRLLDTENYEVYQTHFFMGKGTVKCLGEDCPICKKNRQLRLEHPNIKNVNEIPGYNKRSETGYINVFDKTPVKVCPNAECGHASKASMNKFPDVCPKCGAFLTKIPATPLNKVKLLSKGKEFFEKLLMFEETVLNEAGEPIGLDNFDIGIMGQPMQGQPGKVKVDPIPLSQNQEPVEYDKETLYDLKNCLVVLNSEEMVQFMNGVGLKDIYAARKATPSEVKENASQVAKETAEEVQKKVAQMFQD